jgi:hypothetical protein
LVLDFIKANGTEIKTQKAANENSAA